MVCICIYIYMIPVQSVNNSVMKDHQKVWIPTSYPNEKQPDQNPFHDSTGDIGRLTASCREMRPALSRCAKYLDWFFGDQAKYSPLWLMMVNDA